MCKNIGQFRSGRLQMCPKAKAVPNSEPIVVVVVLITRSDFVARSRFEDRNWNLPNRYRFFWFAPKERPVSPDYECAKISVNFGLEGYKFPENRERFPIANLW